MNINIRMKLNETYTQYLQKELLDKGIYIPVVIQNMLVGRGNTLYANDTTMSSTVVTPQTSRDDTTYSQESGTKMADAEGECEVSIQRTQAQDTDVESTAHIDKMNNQADFPPDGSETERKHFAEYSESGLHMTSDTLESCCTASGDSSLEPSEEAGDLQSTSLLTNQLNTEETVNPNQRDEISPVHSGMLYSFWETLQGLE